MKTSFSRTHLVYLQRCDQVSEMFKELILLLLPYTPTSALMRPSLMAASKAA